MQLIFVHIPKTAGTAFREALFRARPLATRLCDYGPCHELTSPLVRALRHDPGGGYERLAVALQEEPAYTLAGHMKAAQLARAFSPAQFVTLLREPVSHVASYWRHERRRGAFEGSLTRFAERDCYRNIQSRMVGHIPLRLWLLVGRQERLTAEAALLSEIIGARLKPKRLNVAPPGPCEIGAFERRRLEDLNALDMELYEGVRAGRGSHQTDMQSA